MALLQLELALTDSPTVFARQARRACRARVMRCSRIYVACIPKLAVNLLLLVMTMLVRESKVKTQGNKLMFDRHIRCDLRGTVMTKDAGRQTT